MIRIQRDSGIIREVYGVVRTKGSMPAYATLEKKRDGDVGTASSFEKVKLLGDEILYRDDSLQANEEDGYDGFIWYFSSIDTNPMDIVIPDTNGLTTRFMKQEVTSELE